jgi:pseudaminic acid biosynthesis-associated methylase
MTVRRIGERIPDTARMGNDVGRLEDLWGGEFGDRYVERNREAAQGREPFWRGLHERHPFSSALEVGCNVGGNLYWLAQLLEPREVFGVDINTTALRELRGALPDVNPVYSPARSLPFRDARFELTFTTGVLIHQAPESLAIVMSEVVRCSSRYVLCGEYHADELEEIPYRGERGALYKRDWGALYQSLFPELTLLERSFAPKSEGGWDDVTFWLFEKAH